MPAEIRQLPRGRHRLTRQEVLASQRGRMLAAVAEAVASKGFARVSVADVINRAGVSRETFYEQFADKEACFLAALDAGAEALLADLREAMAIPASASRLERLGRVLDAYLGALAAEPLFAKAFLIGAYGAGEKAIRRRIELQQRFVDLVAEILGAGDRGSERLAREAVVAAISSLATTRIGAGRSAELPGLAGPIVELVERLFPVDGTATEPSRRRMVR